MKTARLITWAIAAAAFYLATLIYPESGVAMTLCTAFLWLSIGMLLSATFWEEKS